MKLVMRVDALEIGPWDNAQVSLSTVTILDKDLDPNEYEQFLDLEVPKSEIEHYAPGKEFIVEITAKSTKATPSPFDQRGQTVGIQLNTKGSLSR